MKNLLKELKEFILRGNVVDLAVGFIIGAAFSGIVASLVNDVLMPPLGLVLGNIDFSNMFINLSGQQYASLSAAKAAGAATINYGLFINTLINFLIVAIVLFFIIRFVNHLQPKKKVVEKQEKECTYCLSTIPAKATRCPNCTSTL